MTIKNVLFLTAMCLIGAGQSGCTAPFAMQGLGSTSPVAFSYIGSGKGESFWLARYDDVVQATQRAGQALSLKLREKKKADAVVISTRGRSKLATFFVGDIANKVLEYSRICPIWMVKGTVKKKHALLAIDNSKNALRTVDHVDFMLSDTDVKVTLFHTKRELSRFIPGAIVEEFPEFQKHWLRLAGKEIAPSMQKARDVLLAAGLRDEQIATKVIDGSRSAAADILKEAQGSDPGSIFMGLHGYSRVKEYTMGSVTRNVLNQAEDMAVCIVP